MIAQAEPMKPMLLRTLCVVLLGVSQLPAQNGGSSSKASHAAAEIGYDALVSRLDNRDPVIRREACKKLGELGDRRAITPLSKMVGNLDEETRFRAVEALGSLLDRTAVPALATAMRDPSRRVKTSAIEGIVTLYVTPPGSSNSLTAPITNVFHRAVDLFQHSADDLIVAPGTQVDPAAIAALGAAVGDPDDETAKQAARAAGVLRGNAAVPQMADVLFHAPPGVKIEIMKAFQKIRDPRAIRDVARLLQSSDKATREQAAYTLGLLGARDQIGPLQKLYENDRDKDVRHSAFEALSLMPQPQHAEWFLKFLDDPDDRLREFAADGLGRVPDSALPPGALDKISTRRTSEKSARVKLALAFALSAHGQTAMLAELMQALDSALHRQYGIAYLTELGRDPARLPQFYPYLRSEKTDIRRYLCDVLAAIANPAALEYVRPLIHDPKDDVITEAIRTVQVLERYQK
jgi:HEAT repeat protein